MKNEDPICAWVCAHHYFIYSIFQIFLNVYLPAKEDVQKSDCYLLWLLIENSRHWPPIGSDLLYSQKVMFKQIDS